MASNNTLIIKPPNHPVPTLPNRDNEIKLVRWRGGQHPTYDTITQIMRREGLRPYSWSNGPNFRIAARSHGYVKVMYCVEGSMELYLPDLSKSVVLRAGDRVEVPRGMRHATIIGPNGVKCVESAR